MFSNQVLQPVAGDGEWVPLEHDNQLDESLNNEWNLFPDLAAQADHEQDVQLSLDLLEADLGLEQLKSNLAKKQDEEAYMHEGFLAVLNRKSPIGAGRSHIPSLEELQIPFTSLDQEVLSTPIIEVRVLAPPKQYPTSECFAHRSTSDFKVERVVTTDATWATKIDGPDTQSLRRGKKRGRPCSGFTKIASKKIERIPGENETVFKRRRNRAQAAISRARKDEQIAMYLEKADTFSIQAQNAKKTLDHTEQVNRLFISELYKHYGEKAHALMRKALMQENLQMV
jgi:hypothetical protein